MGLIQREIEKAGIPTIGISIVREFSEKVKPPRTIYLKWPFGHPLGEPFNVRQQRAVLIEMFNALYTIKKPGEIIDIPFKWKRESYNDFFEINHDKEIIAQEAIENISENRREAFNTMDSSVLKDLSGQAV